MDTATDKEDVNYVSGTGFQNQSGKIKSNGTSQRSNYNQGSQYQKPFNNNNSNTNYGASSYQNHALLTQESKLEAMID